MFSVQREIDKWQKGLEETFERNSYQQKPREDES